MRRRQQAASPSNDAVITQTRSAPAAAAPPSARAWQRDRVRSRLSGSARAGTAPRENRQRLSADGG